jgi:hypothetical protein
LNDSAILASIHFTKLVVINKTISFVSLPSARGIHVAFVAESTSLINKELIEFDQQVLNNLVVVAPAKVWPFDRILVGTQEDNVHLGPYQMIHRNLVLGVAIGLRLRGFLPACFTATMVAHPLKP